LNAFLLKALPDAGYAGFIIMTTPAKTEIEIQATNSAEVRGPEDRRIREVISFIQKRFGYAKGISILLKNFRGPRNHCRTYPQEGFVCRCSS